jgi:hypothetical protein
VQARASVHAPSHDHTCVRLGPACTHAHAQECYQGAHAVLVYAVGIPGVVLFAIGCPLVSAWWLASNAHRLWEPHFDASWGFLYRECACGVGVGGTGNVCVRDGVVFWPQTRIFCLTPVAMPLRNTLPTNFSTRPGMRPSMPQTPLPTVHVSAVVKEEE